MKYDIRYALSGGFGGCENEEWETIECENEQQALDEARLAAIQLYESYEGLHGIRGVQEIMEEDGLDEEDATEAYHEERDGWLDYEARPYVEEAGK